MWCSEVCEWKKQNPSSVWDLTSKTVSCLCLICSICKRPEHGWICSAPRKAELDGEQLSFDAEYHRSWATQKTAWFWYQILWTEGLQDTDGFPPLWWSAKTIVAWASRQMLPLQTFEYRDNALKQIRQHTFVLFCFSLSPYWILPSSVQFYLISEHWILCYLIMFELRAFYFMLFWSSLPYPISHPIHSFPSQPISILSIPCPPIPPHITFYPSHPIPPHITSYLSHPIPSNLIYSSSSHTTLFSCIPLNHYGIILWDQVS